MYAVAVTILFKEGKLQELKDFFENTGFPALEVLKEDIDILNESINKCNKIFNN